ncbi:MAG: cobalamin-binding protein [Actinomycetota bacterium]|nr:cobalamin-binding protein [Actinomycetota bacterium]MDD5666310.1 cobalamin-binding protein [Actinomycetota bacterium]
MRRKYAALPLLAVVLLCLAAFSGCGDSGGGTEPAEESLLFTDDLGREVSLEGVPERIVSASPACTEILFALGLGDRVVGVTDYCDYPPEARSKPSIGTFSSPNTETILAQEPDLVLATGLEQLEFLGRMDEMGIPTYAVNPNSFDQTLATILEIGEITGAAGSAQDIVAEMNARAVDIARAVSAAEAEGKERPRVFYEIFYENNAWTAGSGSIISDLVRMAGGENIGDADSSGYYEFSAERLIAENPQVYLVGSGSMFDPGDITARSGWERIDAVKNGRVYTIDENLVYRTGPRLIEGLEAMHAALYPED